MGMYSLFIHPNRITKVAKIIKPSTLLDFHQTLVKRKYRLLFSPKRRSKPGPKGPSRELIQAIVEMKTRNPRYGCPRIAQQINLAFGTDIDKDVVRRVLAKHYRPTLGSDGPSWLTFLGHMKDSLWSVDLFRCESIVLRTHWVLVVMDQYTRRIIGFGVHAGVVDGPTLCRMFYDAIARKGTPTYLSTDNDPLYLFHRWEANLRILEIDEIKSVPGVPTSHPFIERVIGTVRRELLDQVLFWNATDLERKLIDFQYYYNEHRVHTSLDGCTPPNKGEKTINKLVELSQYRWQAHCRGMFHLPVAA
jgi:transposase InsO family protein